MLGREDPPVQAGGLRVGVGGELLLECLTKLPVLGERLLAPPVGGIDPHQGAVSRLVQRVLDDRPQQLLDGRRGIAPSRQQLSEFHDQRQVGLAQRLAPRRGPILVAVFGQELAPVEPERRHVGLGRGSFAGVRGRPLERIDVDLKALRAQRHNPVAEHQPGGILATAALDSARLAV